MILEKTKSQYSFFCINNAIKFLQFAAISENEFSFKKKLSISFCNKVVIVTVNQNFSTQCPLIF
jgi:hypothetical protein